ncbi:hypothetical protein [Lichenifustis flavocetrariae]|uniref:Uncharacterized protein n=1 Tax=Lichenifustis flavocetrariae TaxID=2949735 RepID=A0AA41YR84_9HYPH|nr:hypothetical protein [Lichenifustis flavocetrariae]MCW6507079.1 hypothetical protein [Lichenifustis flavocetrariae]
MADEDKGTWEEDVGGHFDADLDVRSIGGHAYRVVTIVDYWCDVRTDTVVFGGEDIRNFRADNDHPDLVVRDGDEVAWDDVPEQDRTEIEAALEKRALEKAMDFFRDSWIEGNHPFPRNDDDDEVAA